LRFSVTPAQTITAYAQEHGLTFWCAEILLTANHRRSVAEGENRANPCGWYDTAVLISARSNVNVSGPEQREKAALAVSRIYGMPRDTPDRYDYAMVDAILEAQKESQ
jgi:hypothetical protein